MMMVTKSKKMTLRCKFLKGQRVSSNHMTQCINKQIGTLPAVKPELHLMQVGLEMLGANLVPATNDATLEQRECGFNCVCMDVSTKPDIFTGAVVDGFMLHITHSVLVGRKFICNEYVHIFADVLAYILRQCPTFRILSMEEAQGTITLPDTNDYFFGFFSGFHTETFLDAAHIGFVHLNSTVQHRAVYLCHSGTNTMAKIPCGLVGTFVLSPKGTLELHSTHPFLRFTDQEHRNEPYRQRQMRVMEDGATGHGELILATNALIARVFLQTRYASVFTAGAHNTFGPAKSLQKLAALCVGREHLIHIKECHGSTS